MKSSPAANAQGAPLRRTGAPLERREHCAHHAQHEGGGEKRRDRFAQQDHGDGEVSALERHQRRDQPEVADVEAAQQAEQRAEVQDAGERRQPGAGPLALVRQTAQDEGDRQDDEGAGRQHPDHLRERPRLARDTLREHVAGRVGEGREQA